MKPYQGKKDNAGIVAKLNELIEHISKNTDVVSELKTTVSDLKTSLENSQKELNDFKGNLKSSEVQVMTLQKQVVGLSARCEQLQQVNIRIQDHLTNMESQSRRNNLLMDCVPETQDETNDKCKAVLLDILDGIMKVSNVRNFQIVRCHRLGRYNPKSLRPRPIIFKLHWFGDREAIWDKLRELKNHPYWIQEDFPSVIVQRRRALTPIVKAARNQGKKAFLSVDSVVIDDQSYTMKTLYRLPRDLHQ
jgi:hypothetical protein